MVAAVVQVVLIGILIAARPEFYTRVRRGAGWKALGVLIVGLAVGTLLGWGLVELFPGTLPPNQRFLWALNRVTALAAADNEQFDGRPHGFVNTLLGLFGAIALLAAVITLFRAQRSNNALTGNDESAMRGSCCRTARTTPSATSPPAATRPSCSRRAARRRSPTASSSACAWPAATRSATRKRGRTRSRRGRSWPSQYGWATAVMGASETGATAYNKAGLTVLQLGDEAILRTREFNLSGRDMRQVRQAVTRVRRQGVTVRIRTPPRHPRRRRWPSHHPARGRRGATPRPSAASPWPSAGSVTASTATACWSEAIAEDETSVDGMLSLVPWGPTGVSLDLMRRKPTSPNGVVELMVSELATTSDQYRHHQGVAELRGVPLGLRGRLPHRRRTRSCGSGARCSSSSPAGGSSRRCTGRT